MLEGIGADKDIIANLNAKLVRIFVQSAVITGNVVDLYHAAPLVAPWAAHDKQSIEQLERL